MTSDKHEGNTANSYLVRSFEHLGSYLTEWVPVDYCKEIGAMAYHTDLNSDVGMTTV